MCCFVAVMRVVWSLIDFQWLLGVSFVMSLTTETVFEIFVTCRSVTLARRYVTRTLRRML